MRGDTVLAIKDKEWQQGFKFHWTGVKTPGILSPTSWCNTAELITAKSLLGVSLHNDNTGLTQTQDSERWSSHNMWDVAKQFEAFFSKSKIFEYRFDFFNSVLVAM